MARGNAICALCWEHSSRKVNLAVLLLCWRQPVFSFLVSLVEVGSSKESAEDRTQNDGATLGAIACLFFDCVGAGTLGFHLQAYWWLPLAFFGLRYD